MPIEYTQTECGHCANVPTLYVLPEYILENIRKFQLSENDLEQIQTMKFDKFVDVTIYGISITPVLLNQLRNPHTWLDDEMINAYFKLLGAEYSSSLFFSTYFITELVRGAVVDNWVGYDVLEYETLVFPIHINNNHW